MYPLGLSQKIIFFYTSEIIVAGMDAHYMCQAIKTPRTKLTLMIITLTISFHFDVLYLS